MHKGLLLGLCFARPDSQGFLSLGLPRRPASAQSLLPNLPAVATTGMTACATLFLMPSASWAQEAHDASVLGMSAAFLSIVLLVWFVHFSRVKSWVSQQCFAHLDPGFPTLHSMKMSGRQAPFVFLTAPACDQLTEYIRDDPSGPFAGSLDWPDMLNSTLRLHQSEQKTVSPLGRWKEWDFNFSQREPFLLKADWHTVPGKGSDFEVFVPRMDDVVAVQRAPRRILAFVQAFREVNGACWQAIADGLQRFKEMTPIDPHEQQLLDILLKTFRENGHFSAVEVQAGPATASREMCWHRDGATGLLHLGITLSGRRVLRLHSCSEKGHREHEVSMTAGSIYLSSPFLFDHCVSYEAHDNGDGPLLALMCRFGFLAKEDALWVNHQRSPHMLKVVELLAKCLRAAVDENSLRIPSLQEVQDFEARSAR